MRNSIHILLLLLLAGCTRERWIAECAGHANCTVRFTLVDEHGADIFDDEVQCVDLFVYDAVGTTVVHSSIGQAELRRFAGKRMQLPAGDYTVLAWGNALRSTVEDERDGDPEDRDHTRVTIAVPTPEGDLDDGDPLYYAPRDRHRLNMTVRPDSDVEVVAEMRHAHVKLDVTIEGWENLPLDPNAQRNMPAVNPFRVVAPAIAPGAPHVTVTDLVSHYDFAMRGFGGPVSYGAYAQRQEGCYKRRFNIPIFDRSTPTRIIVSDNYGRPVYPDIAVSRLVPPEVDLDTVRRLPVTVRFYKVDDNVAVDVIVNVPEWNETSVTPE